MNKRVIQNECRDPAERDQRRHRPRGSIICGSNERGCCRSQRELKRADESRRASRFFTVSRQRHSRGIGRHTADRRNVDKEQSRRAPKADQAAPRPDDQQ